MSFKKVLALVLVVAMCLSMIPTYAFADFDELVEEAAVEEAAPAEEFDEWLEDDAPAVQEPEEATEAEEPAAEPEEVPAEEAAAPAAEGLSIEYTADYAAKNVAEVLTSDGWYQFTTLAEAIAKVGTTEVDEEGTEIVYGTEVTLLNNATVNGLVIDKDVTIYGNSRTLNGTLIINDGSVAFDGMNFVGDMTVNGGDLIINGGTFGNVVAGSDTVSGSVTGGTFKFLSSQLCEDGYVFNGDTGEVVEKSTVAFKAYVGDGVYRVNYVSFGAALTAANGEKVITLLKDINYKVKAGETVLVNANGYKFIPSSADSKYKVEETQMDGYVKYESVIRTFTITYKNEPALAESEADPTANFKNSYNLLEEDFTLETPVRQGYTFVGWVPNNNPTATPVKEKEVKVSWEINLGYTAKWASDEWVAIQPSSPWGDFQHTTFSFADNTATYGGTEIKYSEAENPAEHWTIGRIEGTAYVGVQFQLPDSFEQNRETYTITRVVEGVTKSWLIKDDNDLIGNTLSEWVSIDVAKIEEKLAAGENYSFSFAFDKEGDGTPEQTITVVLDLTNITLKKGVATDPQIKVEEGVVVDKDLMLHIGWKLFADDAEVATSTDIRYNTNPTVPAELVNPIKKGYTFQNLAYEDGSPFNADKKLKEDTEIHGVWEVNGYTITLDTAGGEEIEPISYNIEMDSFELPTPKRAGYTFTGWTAPKITKDPANPHFMVNPKWAQDFTATANWTPNSYKVIFDSNIASAEGINLTGTMEDQTFAYGSGKALTTGAYRDSNGNYAFSGWTENADGTGTVYTDKQWVTNLTTDVDGEVTLYAKWVAKQYTVKFENKLAADGETIEDQVLTYPAAATEPAPAPVKEGYTLQGWTVASQTDIPTEVPEDFVAWDFTKNVGRSDTNDGDAHKVLTLYAYWTINTSVVTFDAGEGTFTNARYQDGTHSDVTNNTVYKYGDDIHVYTPTSDPVWVGHNFLGWIDGEGAVYTTAQLPKSAPAQNMTYTADWDVKTITIPVYNFADWQKDDKEPIVTITGKFGEAFVIPTADIDKEHYTWVWFEKTDRGFVEYEAPETIPDAPADFALYVQYTPVEYTITYNLEGGSEASIPANYKVYNIENDDFQIPNATWTDQDQYEFIGWTNEEYTEPTRDIVIHKGTSGDLEFTANWRGVAKPITFENVDFDLNPDLQNVTVNYNDVLEQPADPVRADGAKFVGWYKDTEFTTPATFPVTVLRSETFYARFAVISVSQRDADPLYFDDLESAVKAQVEPETGADLRLITMLVEHTYAPTAVPTIKGKEFIVANPDLLTFDFSGIENTYAASTVEVTADGTKFVINPVIAKIVHKDRPIYNTNWETVGYETEYFATIKEASAAANNTQLVTVTADAGSYQLSVGETLNAAIEDEGEVDGALKLTAPAGYVINPKGAATATVNATATAYSLVELHSVTYDPDGGIVTISKKDYTEPRTISAGTDHDIAVPYDCVRPGYGFDGWFDEEGNKVEVLPTTMPDHDVTYTARWTIGNITITFRNFYSGELINTASGEFDSAVTVPDMSIPGYNTPVIYDTGKTEIIDVESFKFPAEDTVYFVNYGQAITYSISYDYAGGKLGKSVTNPVYYTVETDTFKLNNPTRAGYTFAGWTGTELEAATQEVTIAKGSIGDREYTATWTENDITLTFVTGEGATQIDPIIGKTGAAVTAPADPEKTGYTFVGWKNAKDTIVKIPATFPTADATYTAEWNANKYTVHFDANTTETVTGSMKDQTYTYDEPKALPVNSFKFANHEFGGWMLDPNGTTADFADKESVSNLSSTQGAVVNLYALWLGAPHTVTFVAGEGATDPEAQTVRYPALVTEPEIPVREDGAAFRGWYETGATEPFDFSKPIEKDVVLTAAWAIVTVSQNAPEPLYFDDFDDAINAASGNALRTISLLTDVEFAPDAATARSVSNKEFTVIKSDDFDLTFDFSGTNNTYAVTVVADNESSITYKVVPVIVKVDTNVFELDENWDPIPGTNFVYFGTVKDASAYANNTLTVIVTGNAGEYVLSVGETLNAKAEGRGALTVSAPEGYVVDPDGTAKAEMTADTELKAYTLVEEHTVTYVVDGGSVKMSDKTTSRTDVELKAGFDHEIAYPVSATKTGATFAGWYNGDVMVSDADLPHAMPNEDVTYTAHWSNNSIELSIVDIENPDVVIWRQTGEYGDALEGLDKLLESKPGYGPKTTINYYTTEEKTKTVNPKTLPAATATYYAEFLTNDLIQYPFTWNLAEDENLVLGATKYASYNVTNEPVTIGNAVKSGYDFIGWTVKIGDAEATTWTKSDEEPNYIIPVGTIGNIELTPIFSVAKYTVTIAPNGGSFVEGSERTYEVEFNSEIPYDAYAATLVREGNSITSWLVKPTNSSSTATYENNLEKMPSEDITITAIWAKNKYTLSFDGNGGTFTYGGQTKLSTWSSDEVEFAAPIALPTAAALTGYTLQYWEAEDGTKYGTKADEAKGIVEFPGSMPANDLKLKAVWDLTAYTITFKSQILNGSEQPTALTKEEEANVSYNNVTGYDYDSETITLADPAYEGYTFIGWTTNGVTEPTKDLTIETNSTGNKTFTANWARMYVQLNPTKVYYSDLTKAIKASTGNDKREIVLLNDVEYAPVANDAYSVLDKTFVVSKISEGELSFDFATANSNGSLKYAATELEGTATANKYVVKLAVASVETGNSTWNEDYTVETKEVLYFATVEDASEYADGKLTVVVTADLNDTPYTLDEDETLIIKVADINAGLTVKAPANSVLIKDPAFESTNNTEHKIGLVEATYTVVPQRTLTYDPNGGWLGINHAEGKQTADVQTAGAGEAVVKPDAIVWAGRTFDGWYNGETKVEEANLPAYMPEENTVLTAHWTDDDIVITIYDKDDPSETPAAIWTKTGKADEEIGAIELSKVGYDGLYKLYETKTSDNEVTVPATFPTASKEYYAQFTDPIIYSVTWNLEATDTVDDAGHKYTAYRIVDEPFYFANPVRTGYDFTGWTVKIGDTETSWTKTETEEHYTVPAGTIGDIELTPNFDKAKFTITVKANGGTFAEGSVDTYEVTYEDAIPYATYAETLSKEGYEISFWYVNKVNGDGNIGEAISPIPATMPAEDLILTPNWSEAEFAISFYVEGSTVPFFTENHKFNDSLRGITAKATQNLPAKDGYEFDAVNPAVPLNMPANDVAIEVSYKPTDYTVTLESDLEVQLPSDSGFTPGDGVYTKSYNIESDSFVLPTPEATGNDFVGWSKKNADNTYGDPVENVTIEKGSFGDVTYKAIWKLHEYTVTFDTDGGTPAVAEQKVQYQNYATKPEATNLKKQGYKTFDGNWYLVDENGDLSPTAFNFAAEKITKDITLKAKWEGLDVTIIWQDTSSGSILLNETQRVGDDMVAYVPAPLPTRENYRLDSENLWKPAVPEKVPYVASNTLMYALNWIETVTVTFLDEDLNPLGNAIVDKGTALKDSADVPVPAEAGKVYAWTLKGEEYDMTAPVTAKMTLVGTLVDVEPEEDYSDYASVVSALDLVDNINIHAYVTIKEDTDPSDYEVLIDFNGKTTKEGTLDQIATFDGSEYKIENIAVVAAPQMNDPAIVNITYKGNDVVVDEELSVRGYAEKWIERDSVPGLKNVLIALLDYGAYSQLQFNYQTDNLVNTKYSSGNVESTSVPESYPVTVEGSVTGIGDPSIALTLVSNTTMNMYFSAAKKASFQFKIDGKEAEATYANKEYKVALTEIRVADLDVKHTFTVTRGNATMSVTAAPLAYAFQHQNDTGALGNVCKAVYLYYQAADAYFG